jgi:hypothetical protein
MKKILELDPSNDQAKKSIHRLGPLAEEKREKMKEEMICKHSEYYYVPIFSSLTSSLLSLNLKMVDT